MKIGITSKTNSTILALQFKRIAMVHTNKHVEKIYFINQL